MTATLRWSIASALLCCAAIIAFAVQQANKNAAPSLAKSNDAAAAPFSPAVIGTDLTPEERINEILKQPTEFNFKNATLEQVAAIIGKKHQLQVQIDNKALDDASYLYDRKFSKQIKNVPLRAALRLLLNDAELSYVVKNDVLVLTTKSAEETDLITRVYHIADIHEPDQFGEVDIDGMLELLETTVQPTTWKMNGGAGDLTPLGINRLVVCNTQEVHEQLDDLFEKIRRDKLRHPSPELAAKKPLRAKQRETPQFIMPGDKPGFGDSTVESTTPQLEKMSLTDGHKKAATASNHFGLDFYLKQTAKQPDKNFFCSPLSISTVLGMTALGAKDQTLDETCRVLRWEEDGKPKPLHAETRELLAEMLRANESQDVKITNRQMAWLQAGMPIVPAFTEALTRDYQATPVLLDFRNDPTAARKTILQWANGQIPRGVDQLLTPEKITPLTRFVVANAITFTGKWEQPFLKETTREGPYYPTPETIERISFLRQTAHFEFTRDTACRILRMPYRQTRFGCVYILPEARDGLAKLEQTLTPQKLQEWLGALMKLEVDVAVPKFSVAWHAELNETLKELGMKAPFNLEGAADYSGITTVEPLYLQTVLHQAEVEFDEEGTVARAITFGGGGYFGGGPPKPQIFHADHPFLFLIMDNHSGAILFMGRYVQPETGAAAIPPVEPKRGQQGGGMF